MSKFHSLSVTMLPTEWLTASGVPSLHKDRVQNTNCACSTASKRIVSLSEPSLQKILWWWWTFHLLWIFCFLSVWSCPGSRGGPHNGWALDWQVRKRKKPLYRDALFVLSLEFSQDKNVCTCGKIIWLKFAWIWTTIADVLVLRPFSRQVCFHTEHFWVLVN